MFSLHFDREASLLFKFFRKLILIHSDFPFFSDTSSSSSISTTKLFIDPDSVHEHQKVKLEHNESIRLEIYEKYLPFFILSGVTFIILSIVWIIYNILSYRRSTNKIKKLERLGRQIESERLLRIYHQVPIQQDQT